MRDVREGEQLRFSPEPLDRKRQQELEQLTQHLEQEYDTWERIYLDGGSDAYYEDGIGLELTRNHIIYEKRKLLEKYPNHLPEVYNRELPPEMPRKYQSVKKGDTLRLENEDFIVVEIAEKSPPTGDYSVTLQGENGDLSVRDLRNIKTRFRNLTNHGEAPTYEITSAGFAIPSDLEKYYVNRENESLTSVYFNPDSDAGGQFVYKHFSFDELLKAMGKPDPLDELESISRTELVDIDTSNFKESARNFLKKDEDFNNRDSDVLAEFSAVMIEQTEPKEDTPDENSPIGNHFKITDESLGEGGAKSKYKANIEAIKLLQRLENESRQATPDEQEILSKYVGWGGLSQAFEQNNSAWESEYAELHDLLTTEEYESARASTLNAHYTPPVIIEAMYQALENFGFQGGKILEPSMGIGNFLGKIPDEMRPNAHFSGVELDSISGRIAKQLYPTADISIMGFEKKSIPDNAYDVAIGNIPFGNYGLSDPVYNKHNFLIHDYFFAKSLDKVAPGGIVAFISSKGTLDKQGVAFREYLADRADLIGAIRLPNNAFKAAGTGVTSDIIFLKKRTDPPIEKPDWVFTAENENGISLNQYFINHPEMILGKMEMVSGRFGEEAACIPNTDESFKEQLNRAVANLKAQITVDRQQREQEMKGIVPAAPNVRNFTFTSINDKIYFRENDIMKEVKLSVQQAQCVQGLIGIRQSLRELMDAQVNGCTDDELSDYQKQLDVLYEKFVQKYGHINGNKISTIFREDDDFNLLRALEIVNPETKEITKSEIFTDRTIKVDIIVDHAETAEEALQISMDLRGKVDIAYMADLVGTEKGSIISELTKNDLIFLNPAKISENSEIYEAYEERSEYLSGNIREKLDGIAFQEIKYAQNPDMLKIVQHNKAALEAVLPPTIAAGDIKAEIGVNWVDPSDYEQFIAEYSGLDLRSVSKYTPLRRTLSGEYKIENKNYFNTRIGVTSTAGTKRVNSFKILENLLNKRDVVVKDVVYDHGEVKSVINKKETDLAQEKARQMKEAFAKWVFADPSRREKYVEKYNRLFNSIVGRHYDGSKQTFPGMSPDIALRPHQKDAIARAKLGGNTLLAHAVGAGKSFEMVAATMERKRLGLISKACVVVPKHLVGQTALEWQRLYPNAHLLTATEKDFTKDNRKKFVGRCVTGNYDAVIMSYEQFEKIPMSDSYRVDFLEREIDEVMDGLDDARLEGNKNSVKDLERKKKELERKLNKLLESSGKTKDKAVNFEQLGFDYLVVDEAHNYKNGLVITKMTNVSGVQSTPAQKSEDILMKCQYLNEKTGHKSILFATGTPVSNSMVELYTMQRYLRPDLLQKAELYTFDDWASNFGEVVSQLELKPAGDGFRTKKRFAKFNNLPELMQLYREFADIKTAESLNLPVPNIIGGKAQTVVAKPDDFQKAYIQSLAERSERIQNGSVDPSEDNMLKITHEARLLGLDSRAINPDAENRPDSKVNLCIDNIMKIYHDTDEQKGVQIVFCDIAVHADPENGKWSVYDNIKQELIKRGMPEEEICFAGDAKNQAERNEMYAQLRSGTKRLVISSTQKMGTGANIQTRLAALHHLDIPWKPSDLEQQNGRILRQGNQFSDVGIYHYVTEGTFDAYMLSIITTKQRFISQIMSGKAAGRSCSDVDEMVLNYSEMQAIATGDPRIKEKIELDGEVAKLRVLESEHTNMIYRMQDNLPLFRESLEREKRILEGCKADLADRDKALTSMPKDDFAGMKINGVMFRERKAAGAAMRPLIYKVVNNEAEKCTVGEYGGFTVGLEKLKSVDQYCRLFIMGSSGIKYYTTDIEMASDTGNVQRIENLFKAAIEKKIAATEEHLDTDTQNIKEVLEMIQKPFERAAELQEKSARLEQLNRELNVDRADEQFVCNEEDQPDDQEQEIKRSKPKR